jgi:hypothetical protein
MKLTWVVVVVAACGDGSKGTIDAGLDGAPPGLDACVPASATRTIFLNRGGGAYTVVASGQDDAATNKSFMIGQDRTLAAATATESDWTAVLTCVRANLAPYAVTVTDADPSPAQHVEVVVIDDGAQIGITGLAAGAPTTPCAGGFGSAATNLIAFSVWGTTTNAARCWNLSMAIGYTAGLDNVLECSDLMSATSGCDIASKKFTTMNVLCGELTARNCRCGGTSQNAAARLTANLGASCL